MEKLKTINLKGNQYVQVKTRIQWFRENVQNGYIQTGFQMEGEKVFCVARIFVDEKCVATAHACKVLTKVVTTDSKDRVQVFSEFELEKCETRAIGRALGVYGIGIECGVSTYEEAREYFETEGKALDNEYLDKIKE